MVRLWWFIGFLGIFDLVYIIWMFEMVVEFGVKIYLVMGWWIKVVMSLF